MCSVGIEKHSDNPANDKTKYAGGGLQCATLGRCISSTHSLVLCTMTIKFNLIEFPP